MAKVYQNIPQGHLEKSTPPVKEVTERQTGYHEQLNPTRYRLGKLFIL